MDALINCEFLNLSIIDCITVLFISPLCSHYHFPAINHYLSLSLTIWAESALNQLVQLILYLNFALLPDFVVSNKVFVNLLRLHLISYFLCQILIIFNHVF